jgi:hypothetical protein
MAPLLYAAVTKTIPNDGRGPSVWTLPATSAGRITHPLRPARSEHEQRQGVAVPRKGQHHAHGALGPGGSISRGTRFGQGKARALKAERDRLLEVLYARGGPAELWALRRSGLLDESAVLATDLARSTMLRLRQAVEGEPDPITGNPLRPLSPQRVTRLEHAERLLAQGIALELRALTTGDREAASSSGTLIRAADAITTAALGMDLEHDVPDLRSYLAQRQQTPTTSAGATNGADREVPNEQPINAAQEGEA